MMDLPKSTDAATGPIFVLGCPRSGTTALGTALQQHPLLAGGTESHFFMKLLENFDDLWSYSTTRLPENLCWLRQMEVDQAEFLQTLGIGLRAMVDGREGSSRWVDHTGGNVLVADRLAAMFTDARFVVLVRDGRNVVESIQHSFFGGDFSFRSAMRMWAHHVDAGLELLDGPYAQRFHLVRHEDLLADPDRQLSTIFAFLDVPPHEPAGEIYRRAYPHNSAFPDFGPGTLSSVRWECWERWKRKEFEAWCGHLLRRLSYEPSDRWTRVDTAGWLDD